MSDIFVSYVEEDSSLAIQIVEMLEQAGYSTWCYERDGVPGLKFISQITQAIAEAKAMVLVISVQSMSSQHVEAELFQAYDRKKHVIPLTIGVTYEEIRRRRPDWLTMLGATVSVPVDASTVAGVVTRVIQSLKTQGIQPTRKPDKPADQPAAHEPSVKIAEPRLSEKPADQKLPAEPFRDIPVDKRRRSLNPVWIGLGVMVVIAIIVAVVLYSCRGNPASNIGNNTPTSTAGLTTTPSSPTPTPTSTPTPTPTATATPIPPRVQNILMVIAPNNFSAEELLEPKRLFELRSIKVTICSTTTETALGQLGETVKPDISISEAQASDYDAIVIVGGGGAQQYLWGDAALRALVKEAYDDGRVVSAICLAPVVLARAGILEGKKATVYEDQVAINEMIKYGASYVNKGVVVTGKVITARGPESSGEFAEAILSELSATAGT